MTPTLLTADSIGTSYGDVAALRDVSFGLDQGITALVGVNGAGKSTLLRTLAGAQSPDRGAVLVNGVSLYGRRRREALMQVALMPQDVRFPSRMTASEVVTYVAWMRGLPLRRARERAGEALLRVDLHAESERPVKALSGGMLRRVALAQALVAKPRVLLLDEPSTGLDPRQRRLMVEVLQSLESCVLMSSHVMEDVTDLAERVIVLDQGRVRFAGSLSELCAMAPQGSPADRCAERAFLELVAAGVGR